MRLLNTSCLVVLLSAMAAAQATVIGGTASTWVPAYGVYAAPFVPLVMTPTVALTTVSPSGAGASNATFGNVAGATNATLSMTSQQPVGVYTQLSWYGPSAAVEVPTQAAPEMSAMHKTHGFDAGVASWDSSVSVKNLMAGTTGAKKAARTYTNQDVDQVNQTNGMVKYRGKTEHI